MAAPIEEYHRQDLLERSRKTSRRFWMILIGVFAFWSALILTAPLAAAAGAETGAHNLYTFFSYICHQLPSRSFYLIEHKFGVCSRCSGVYFGLLAGTLAYPIFRQISEVNPLPRIWLVLAMVPISVDWSLTYFEIWQNTFFTRFATGLILGIACSVFIIPALAELALMIHLKRQGIPANPERPA